MLPKEAAALLHVQPAVIQELVCKRVRDALVFLESLDVVMDPVVYEAVVIMLVAQDLPVAWQLKKLLTENKELRDLLGAT